MIRERPTISKCVFIIPVLIKYGKMTSRAGGSLAHDYG
jgi:hypothetical protein